MAKVPGRRQREPMERLVRLAAVLQHAGERGVPKEKLIDIAGFSGGADAGSQLDREFRHLRAFGWCIDNIAEPGEPGVYRMTSVDNRLRVRLTPGQQAALRRAVLLADRADLLRRLDLDTVDGDQAEPLAEVAAVLAEDRSDDRLATVLRANRYASRLRFRYAGSLRVVDPATVTSRNGIWYLRAREVGDTVVKAFVVSRMGEISADEPGTARPVESVRRLGLNPLAWQVDPPVDVTLAVPEHYLPDVRFWLGEPVRQQASGDGVVEVTYEVTNRAALRQRLIELGTRATLVGPPDVRAELIAELQEMAGE